MTKPVALIFGITGQDGSYLARHLLGQGYEVHGFTRRTSLDNRTRLIDILPAITLHEGDLADSASIWRTIHALHPTEVYNLAAQTHVHTSFAEAEHTADINALGPVRILEAIRTLAPDTRFYQASTSEMFGNTAAAPLNESALMQPASPYAAAKHYAYTMTRLYRDAYGLFACNGILFNHESPVRGHDFVTAKIAAFAARVKSGTWQGEPLKLGNLNAARDWGHARDYVRGMHAMLQYIKPDDYVLATGTAYSVRDFATAAFLHIGHTLEWSGQGATIASGQPVIITDPALLRPVDVDCLIGDSTHARQTLNWHPETSFEALVADMVDQCLT